MGLAASEEIKYTALEASSGLRWFILGFRTGKFQPLAAVPSFAVA